MSNERNNDVILFRKFDISNKITSKSETIYFSDKKNFVQFVLLCTENQVWFMLLLEYFVEFCSNEITACLLYVIKNKWSY